MELITIPSWSTSLVIAITAAIIGGIVTSLSDHLFDLFRLGTNLFTKKRTLAGIWHTSWDYEIESKRKIYRDTIRLKQYGHTVKGRTTDGRHDYIIKARLLPNGVLQGTFIDVQKHTNWYGSLELLIADDGLSMNGKWISRFKEQIIFGTWNWKKSD